MPDFSSSNLAGYAMAAFSLQLAWLVPGFFYVRMVAKALRRCSPRNRTLSPRHGWMLMVPVFNLFWHFVVINGLTDSMRGELRRRKIRVANKNLMKPLGLAMCALFAGSLLPVIGVWLWGAGVLCWPVYWLQIGTYSGELERRFRPGVVGGQ